MSISDRAKQINAVYEYFRDNITIKNPCTVREAYLQLKDVVRNELQVRDTIRKFNSKKIILSIAEGRHMKYWFNAESLPYVPHARVKKEQVPQEKPIDTHQKPEIRVEENKIVIEHAKCRIIVEF